MISRFYVTMAALASLLAASSSDAFWQSLSKPNRPAVTRTPDGHPDLQGTWAGATLTPLERTAEFAGKATLSDEEALIYEKKTHLIYDERADLPVAALRRRKEGNAVGAEDSEAWEKGSALARVNRLKRTSLIVDPQDGKIPGLTSAAQRSAADRGRNRDRPESVRDLGLTERCLTYSPVPFAPQLYNANYQIVQTAGFVMIISEMIHDARIIRMNSPHVPQAIRQWNGDSVAHWEGDTLVIDTTGFNDRYHFHGSSENLHVIERLSRSGDTLFYQATIDDPDTFTKPWTLEYPLAATTDRIFEYACHEGNSFSVETALKAARQAELAAGVQ